MAPPAAALLTALVPVLVPVLVSVLVIPAGSAAAQPTTARVSAAQSARMHSARMQLARMQLARMHSAGVRVASHRPRTAAAAFHAPHPGGGGGQVISGGRAAGAQGRSGAGRSNQNLNGLQAPTFVMGRTQHVVTDVGGYAGQALVCGSRPAVCLVGQNMPTHFRS
ncbi:hypothetical protein [Microbispora triticiradicis]|nr:hypothetical protein [Microbispora triticiradicis]